MKNQKQANNNNNLKDPTVANDPQAQVEVDDLPISGEQEERVKGGMTSGHKVELTAPVEPRLPYKVTLEDVLVSM